MDRYGHEAEGWDAYYGGPYQASYDPAYPGESHNYGGTDGTDGTYY